MFLSYLEPQGQLQQVPPVCLSHSAECI